MSVAQKLYESGKITYMRTDSVNLSSLALNTAKKAILDEFGEKFHTVRKYRTKSKGAQEAHEAIRPTFIENKAIDGGAQEKKLYDLIRKRTIASQMSNAEIEKTTATISMSGNKDIFTAVGEVIKFEGFLKVYSETQEDDSVEKVITILPPLNQGQKLNCQSINAVQRFSQPPFR